MRIDRFEELHGVDVPLAAVQRALDHDRDGQHPGAQAREARLHVARHRTARRGRAVRLSETPALPAEELRPRQPHCRGRRGRRLVPRLRARDLQPLVRARRGSRQRAQRLGEPEGDRPGPRTRAGARGVRRSRPRLRRRRPPRRKRSASSARRPSSPAAKSSGATTASKTPCAGTARARCCGVNGPRAQRRQAPPAQARPAERCRASAASAASAPCRWRCVR